MDFDIDLKFVGFRYGYEFHFAWFCMWIKVISLNIMKLKPLKNTFGQSVA